MSLPAKIMKRVRSHGRGRRVYTPKDFVDLGNRAAVDQALARLIKSKQLRRLGRGLYDFPRFSRLLKRPVPPKADMVAVAVAGHGAHVLPDGMTAANALGLTTAVSAKPTFITDGHTGAVCVSGRTVHVKKAPAKLARWMGRPAGSVMQALHWLGPRVVGDPQVASILRANLPNGVKADLKKGMAYMPGWALPVVRQVVAKDQITA